MRFTVLADVISERLNVVSKVANQKTVLPIMNDLLFVLKDNQLTITAINSDIHISTVLTVEGDASEGRCVLPTKLICDTFRQLKGELCEVTYNEDNYAGEVRSSHGVYNFLGREDVYDFPTFRSVDNTSPNYHAVKVNPKRLSDGLSTAVKYSCEDDMKPTMSSVLMEFEPMSLKFVATDAHRIFTQTYTTDDNIQFSVLVPKASIDTITSTLKDCDGLVALESDDDRVQFTADKYVVTTRCVECHFPNYRCVLPKCDNSPISVNRNALLSAVLRCKPFSDENTNIMRLTLDGSNIRVRTEDLAFATSADDVVPYDVNGDAYVGDIGMDIEFMATALKTFTSDYVSLYVKDDRSAVVVKPNSEKESATLVMLMPKLLNV